MAAPHNIQRYGEIWPAAQIKCCLEELGHLRPWVIFSGGWAWHFMSPFGHRELKHAHDHKDIDIFVKPENVAKAIEVLSNRDFKKIGTRFDGLPNNKDFRRYEKAAWIEGAGTPKLYRIIIDFFIDKDLPVRNISGWSVIEPSHLLSLYRSVHSSDNCFAVRAAAALIKKGIDPVGKEELVQIPK